MTSIPFLQEQFLLCSQSSQTNCVIDNWSSNIFFIILVLSLEKRDLQLHRVALFAEALHNLNVSSEEHLPVRDKKVNKSLS